MAARKTKHLSKEWRFYVYVLGDVDEYMYIGKGSGRRLSKQKQKYNLDGFEYARFLKESDALLFEKNLIQEHSPKLNLCAGGGGCKVAKRKVRRRTRQEIEMERVGLRVYAARALLSFCPVAMQKHGFDQSKVDQIRSVAYE